MAYYQFTLPMNTGDTYSLVKTVCEKSCTIKSECPSESIEVKTKFRMGKGSLPFVFYLRELEDGTEVTVCSDNGTLTGALAAMGNKNKEETIWDLPDKEWSDLIEDFTLTCPGFPLRSGKPVPVAAVPCDDGIAQESIGQNKPFSLGRAAVGGLAFGYPGALMGGMSGTKKTKTQTRNVFSSTILFRVLYSNGRVIERTVKKNSREYAELSAKVK
jgi:hypothetical protein|nr:MAG TPA: hypothetical protein [Caudoviricetes sp.]